MARGAFRGAAAAWLGLITLEVVTSSGGSGKIAGAFTTVNDLLKRAISPDVALIPDHSKPASSSSTSTTSTDNQQGTAGIDPNSPTALAQLMARQGAQAAAGAGAVTAVTSPGGLLNNLPNLTTYTNGAPPPRNAR